jgi:hypothetical protein
MKVERGINDSIGAEFIMASREEEFNDFINRLSLKTTFALNLDMFDDVAKFIALVLPPEASSVVIVSSPGAGEKVENVVKRLSKIRPDLIVMRMFHDYVKNNEIVVGFK